jgi:hypothetical protein
LFHWVEQREVWRVRFRGERFKYVVPPNLVYYSAFTVAELGEMLPYECESGKTVEGTVAGEKGRWVCLHDGKDLHKEYAETEADARAKMVVYVNEILKKEV